MVVQHVQGDDRRTLLITVGGTSVCHLSSSLLYRVYV
jgi:hypothetical protein